MYCVYVMKYLLVQHLNDAWRGYWCGGTPSVPCRAAAGKHCLSVGMHIYHSMTGTTSTSGSVLCTWERFTWKVTQDMFAATATTSQLRREAVL